MRKTLGLILWALCSQILILSKCLNKIKHNAQILIRLFRNLSLYLCIKFYLYIKILAGSKSRSSNSICQQITPIKPREVWDPDYNLSHLWYFLNSTVIGTSERKILPINPCNGFSLNTGTNKNNVDSL